ncbi:hypothetical protein [Halorhodospira halochloris]|uniref:hypothetical protein n=1 Tax=Halorhodospira halochloris TaxID=1052 RepID=UPI001EE78954|nr:hypothetical protein [Halorhodospira halochloris]MCG5549497.1 hypothetical protein [Halorhodospira halochloris]
MPNYTDILLQQDERSGFIRAQRAPLGAAGGRSEAWLRDLLIENPDILPISEVDSSFAPLVPLCTELHTEAGPIDAAFINPGGRLTFVECKLWRNPEARRKVIAQILDYARAVSKWDYADLQRRVASATGQKKNIPFEASRQIQPDLDEAAFVDATALALQEGRFLLLIAGDGIREGVSGITELITRNAALGFNFGLIEVALYEFGENGLVVQPRVVAKTHTIERNFWLVRQGDRALVQDDEDEASEESPSSNALHEEELWWEPLTKIKFDDPEQESPVYRPRNHVRVQMPLSGIWITAFRAMSYGICGVFLGGNKSVRPQVLDALNQERTQILAELPAGTHEGMDGTAQRPGFSVYAKLNDFESDDECREWLISQLNRFVNAFRPRLKEMSKQ